MDTEKPRENQMNNPPEGPPREPDHTIQDAVKETKEAEASLSEKVEALHDTIDSLAEGAQAGRGWRKDDYINTLEALKAQVAEIQTQWESVRENIDAERRRMESLLQSFPGIIELSTLHAQSLRLNHLEQLVSELFQELHTKKSEARSRKQMVISLVALGVTVVLWGVWILISLLK